MDRWTRTDRLLAGGIGKHCTKLRSYSKRRRCSLLAEVWTRIWLRSGGLTGLGSGGAVSRQQFVQLLQRAHNFTINASGDLFPQMLGKELNTLESRKDKDCIQGSQL